MPHTNPHHAASCTIHGFGGPAVCNCAVGEVGRLRAQVAALAAERDGRTITDEPFRAAIAGRDAALARAVAAETKIACYEESHERIASQNARDVAAWHSRAVAAESREKALRAALVVCRESAARTAKYAYMLDTDETPCSTERMAVEQALADIDAALALAEVKP